MRHLAMTGMETAAMISRIFLGEAIRATPPSARICAGTRSKAMTDTAPAFSAITACSALVTSMMTPPFNISARPVFRRKLVELPLCCDIAHSPFSCFRPQRENPIPGEPLDTYIQPNPGLDLPKAPFTIFCPYHFEDAETSHYPAVKSSRGPRRHSAVPVVL